MVCSLSVAALAVDRVFHCLSQPCRKYHQHLLSLLLSSGLERSFPASVGRQASVPIMHTVGELLVCFRMRLTSHPDGRTTVPSSQRWHASEIATKALSIGKLGPEDVRAAHSMCRSCPFPKVTCLPSTAALWALTKRSVRSARSTTAISYLTGTPRMPRMTAFPLTHSALSAVYARPPKSHSTADTFLA